MRRKYLMALLLASTMVLRIAGWAQSNPGSGMQGTEQQNQQPNADQQKTSQNQTDMSSNPSSNANTKQPSRAEIRCDSQGANCNPQEDKRTQEDIRDEDARTKALQQQGGGN